jgi:hypothetical protein
VGTVVAVILVALIAVATGSGGRGSSASFATAEHAWEACKGGAALGHEDPACKPLAVKACQTEIATASNKQAHGGLACEVAEGRYLGPKSQTEESTTPTQEHTPEESGHTPEENARHRRNLESQKQAHEEVERTLEKDKPQIEQAHREEEKGCYEAGETREECNSPEHQRQEERANAENRQRQIESGELQVHE